MKRSGNPQSENPGYANWSEAEIPEGNRACEIREANSIRPLKNKLFTDEIAEILEVSVNTVKSLKKYAYAELREKLRYEPVVLLLLTKKLRV